MAAGSLFTDEDEAGEEDNGGDTEATAATLVCGW